MALVSLMCTRRVGLGIKTKNETADVFPASMVGVGIEKAQVDDQMLSIVARELRTARRSRSGGWGQRRRYGAVLPTSVADDT